MYLKGLIAATFERSGPLHLLRLNERVSVIPTLRSTDSLIEQLMYYDKMLPLKQENAYEYITAKISGHFDQQVWLLQLQHIPLS